MRQLFTTYARAVALVDGRWAEGIALLLTRVALAGVFWRSGRTKIEDGSWFSISDTTQLLFREEYNGVPLPSELAAALATVSEHVFPALLVLGLLTRLSALALLGMTMVIQIFVYPEAWWQVHALWTAMAGILIVRGGGVISIDSQFQRKAAP